MIHKRVIASLRSQQWTPVVIELVIVILGVFIGLQAANWNQERNSAAQGAVFTEHLKADMRDEDWYYQLLIIYNRQVLAKANEAASALEGRTTIPAETLLVDAYRATQYKQRPRRRSTYDELISTGTIGLIRDQTLRDTAMRLYSVPTFDNMVQEGMQSKYRQIFRMSLPNDVQRTLARNCGDRYVKNGDYASLENVLDYPCRSGLSEDEIRQAVTTLKSNPDMLPSLRLRIADIETRLVDLTGNNRDILEHLRALTTEKR